MVTKNNQESIEDCIESIKDISNDVVFIDMGSEDNTLKIIKQYGYEVFPKKSEFVKDNKNNLIKLSKKEWLFFIEPNEKIINGKNELNNICDSKENIYSILLLQDNILSKHIRIFNKNSKTNFENPIYENIYQKSIKTGIVLKQIVEKTIEDEYKKIIEWRNSERLKSHPLYYESCFYIKNKNYDNFLKTSEKYFFLEKNTDLPSYLMIKYYSALISFYIKKDFKNSIKNIGFCIEKNPTMAEFWCLIGDINFELKKYKKAFYFYDNAIELGKFRSNEDDLSIEINKYKTYPEKMKTICKKLIYEV
jgi:tetratricopeptide (TPR) repeat protein